MKRWLVNNGWFLGAVLFICVYLLLFGTAEVSGSSMEPTYSNGDFLFLYKTEGINRGNIVIIYNETLNKLLCKRVIGVSGDHVHIDSNGLSVNDTLLDESYVKTSDWYKGYSDLDVDVPDGALFVMGDNRSNSTESRQLGCMPATDVLGVSVLNVTKACGLQKNMLVYVMTGLCVAMLLVEFLTRKSIKDKE